MTVNLWVNTDHAIAYLKEREGLPHRVEALEVVLELLAGKPVTRVLDLGTGDGNLLALVLAAHPDATGVGLDFGDEMLRRAHERFDGDARVELRQHDLSQPLPADLEGFDAIVSSFAIHHLDPPRVGELYGEIRSRLRPGGVFANAEHVASPTAELHAEFLTALGRTPAEDDPSNHLVSVEQQLTWLNAVGFVNSECFWKWRELAVVAGTNPR
jgi:cyclopropane fatty-acyl-phospholipid synthase-like methyltransferase